MENVVEQDRDNTVTLINYFWAICHTMHLKMICAKYLNVMAELPNYVCIVNQMTDAKAHKVETILRECLIMDLSRSRINRL